MSAIEELSKLLDKEIGVSDARQEVTNWISTGFPNLNKALSGLHNGGLGYGRLYEIYGPSGSGKTAMATYLMIEAQKKGGVAIFIDYERSFDVGMAKNMGLNTQSPFWIYKAPETWENGNAVAMKACDLIRKSSAIEKDAPIIVVQDSIAAAIPKSVFEKGIEEYNMNDSTALSRVTSTTLKSVASFCYKMDVTCLYLNQIRTKPGIVYGDPTCLRGDVNIPFVDGTFDSIENIVNKKIDKEVWSFNETSKLFESKKISGWVNNGVKRNDVEWVHIRTNGKGTRNGAIGGTFTGDHKLLSKRGWVRADEITTLDKLVSKELSVFSGSAYEFLIGVLNFDCTFLKKPKKSSTTAAISLTDNVNLEYCKWKVEKLSKHLSFKQIDFLSQNPTSIGKEFSLFRSNWTSEIKAMEGLHRNPVVSFGNGMTDIQLAIMIMDDGTIGKSGNYMVSIRRLSGDVESIGAMCNIFGKMGLANNVNYGCGKFSFSVDASKKIAARICKYVPGSMQYKLPDAYKGMYEEFELSDPVESHTVNYVDVVETKNRTHSKRSKSSLTYDLTIDDNHNYLAGNVLNGFVVHNCTPGGKAMEFYASGRIALGRSRIMENVEGEKEKEMVAQTITAKVVKSKHTRPFTTAELRMGFNHDGSAFFDEAWVLIDYLIKLGIMETSGTYVIWEEKKIYKKALVKKIVKDGTVDTLRALVPKDIVV